MASFGDFECSAIKTTTEWLKFNQHVVYILPMFARNLRFPLHEALEDTPVIFIKGARQVGKTTLVRDLLDDGRRYVTLDNATSLAAAQSDPEGFVAGLPHGVVIDEVQKAPALLPAIKEQVDRKRVPGSWLLTGSVNIMASQAVSDSLAGRMESLHLWPLSWGEREGRRESFIDAVFQDTEGDWPAMSRNADPVAQDEIIARIVAGGYPEAVQRVSAKRRGAWFESTINAILERDVRDMAAIQDLAALPRLLRLAAARSGGLCNYASMANDLGMPQSTLKRYLALLQATFLVWELPAWSSNLGQREVKSCKLMVADTGLAAHLLGLTPERLAHDRTLLGGLLETAVAAELAKQSQWSDTRVRLYHWRTHAGREVDIVLEDEAGRLVGVEVKAAATVTAKDVAGLKALRDAQPDRFMRGVVFHLGRETTPFGKDIVAMPMGSVSL